MATKCILFFLLIVSSFFNISCGDKNAAPDVTIDKTPHNQEVKGPAADYTDTILSAQLSSKNPDYEYVARFLPKYFSTFKSFIRDQAVVSALEGLFTKAQKLSATMKNPTDAEKLAYDTEIKNIILGVNSALSKQSKSIQGIFDSSVKGTLESEKFFVDLARGKARDELADFAHISTALDDFAFFSDPYEFEASAVFLENNVRPGIESLITPSIKSELDTLATAIDSINKISRENKLDYFPKKVRGDAYDDALNKLRAKVSAGLDKKITNAKKAELLNKNLGQDLFRKIKTAFKAVAKVTQAAREAADTLKSFPTYAKVSEIETVVKAGDAAHSVTADGSDETTPIIIAARQAAQEAYKAAAGTALAIIKPRHSEVIKDLSGFNKKYTSAQDAVEAARKAYEAVDSLKTNSATKATVDAAKIAYLEAKSAYDKEYKNKDKNDLAKDANDAVEGLVSSRDHYEKSVKRDVETKNFGLALGWIKIVEDKVEPAKLKIKAAQDKGVNVDEFTAKVNEIEEQLKAGRAAVIDEQFEGFRKGFDEHLEKLKKGKI